VSGAQIEIDIDDLKPNYPNSNYSGISKAHNYALHKLIFNQ